MVEVTGSNPVSPKPNGYQPMKHARPQEETFLTIYFLLFSLLSYFVLFHTDSSSGWKFFNLTILYHLTFSIFTYTFRLFTPFQIWKFLLPLSILMVFPDWFLSAVLKILVFPEDGFYKIGTVSGYMAGLWSIPLFFTVYTGLKLEERSVSIIGTCFWVGILSLAIFGGSEATLWTLGSWYATGVKMWNHIALYVLIPELILGVTAYLAYQGFHESPFLFRLGIQFLIMILYLGNLGFFYLLIERIF